MRGTPAGTGGYKRFESLPCVQGCQRDLGGCGRLSVVYNIRQVGSIVIYIGRGSFTCECYRRTQMNWIETEFAFWFRHRRVSSVERNRTTQ